MTPARDTPARAEPRSTANATLLDHLRVRAALAIAVALVAVIARLATPAPPARTVDAIARMLGEAVGGTVGPDDFVWEERGGFLHDALIGRRVLFLAASAERGASSSAPGSADLYRARVRLTRSGRPVSLHGVRDLTETPIGDDRELCARGRRVAFKTSALGGVQGVTVLDLGGDGPDREARTWSERTRAAAEAWLETGSLLGAARIEIAFQSPPSAAQLDLTDSALVMALGPEGLPAALDLATGDLNTGATDPFGARARRIPHPVRPLSAVAEHAARRLLGPRAARVLERAVLTAERTLGRRSLPSEDPPPAPVPPSDAGWPPPALQPRLAPALPGEGAWAPADGPFLAPVSGDGLAHFYQTFLRPDPARPEVRAHLLAIDTRRIELELQAGYDAPRPTIGPRGSGLLPAPAGQRDDASEGDRVIGAFGVGMGRGSGLVAGGRVLIPPQPGVPSLAVDRYGRPRLGAWPADASLLNLLSTFHAVVQGSPLSGTGQDDDAWIAERAALCANGRGFLVHIWGRDLTAAALREAAASAGCEAGMLLGRTPAALGFAYLERRDDGRWDAERLAPAMSISPARLSTRSPGAFAYLVLRDPAPSLPLPEDVSWAPDDGAQPRPAWIPAFYEAEVEHLGARVHLLAISPERLAYRLRAGAREISPRGAPELPEVLEQDEQARVIAAIGLGIGRRRRPRGLAIGGAIGLKLRGKGGLFVVRDDTVAIVPASADLPEGANATELPLTAEEGKLLREGRAIGAMRYRAAACVTDDGTFVVAATTFDSDEATTQALLDLGCARVVALDRGKHRDAFIHRAGASLGGAEAVSVAAARPEASYDDTTLYLLDTPMPGRARRRITP